jgi:hypothetical protein
VRPFLFRLPQTLPPLARRRLLATERHGTDSATVIRSDKFGRPGRRPSGLRGRTERSPSAAESNPDICNPCRPVRALAGQRVRSGCSSQNHQKVSWRLRGVSKANQSSAAQTWISCGCESAHSLTRSWGRLISAVALLALRSRAAFEQARGSALGIRASRPTAAKSIWLPPAGVQSLLAARDGAFIGHRPSCAYRSAWA